MPGKFSEAITQLLKVMPSLSSCFLIEILASKNKHCHEQHDFS